MPALPQLGDGQNNLLRKITENTYQGSLSGQGFQIPPFDEIDIDYYGSTNNIFQVVYKKNGAIVKTLTLTYVGGGVVDNDKIASIS
jgi:hypothetical protein